MRAPPDAATLAVGVRAGERRALARAITLVESEREDLAEIGQEVLTSVLDATGNAVRLGVSGVPGVGKSTFIEKLGMALVQGEFGAPKKVAVLAIDPSSPISGGSILGDKTRMERLSHEPNAYIRPSPADGHLGGVARHTREAMLLCEAAGFDVVVVETVGVGQSEAQVSQMVDTFLLLLLPGGGDELQGVKRGILELSDLVVVHKADGAMRTTAEQTALEYRRALTLVMSSVPGWTVPVRLASSVSATSGAASNLAGGGVHDVWQLVVDHRAKLESSGVLGSRRAEQAERWMWAAVDDGVRRYLAHATEDAADALVKQVRAGTLAPTHAALALLREAGLGRK